VCLKPIKRDQSNPLRDSPALGLVGDEVEALAVANLVEPELMGGSGRSCDLPLLERR